MLKTQTTIELALVLSMVVGALFAMQHYIRRGLQARYKDIVDYTTSEIVSDYVSAQTQYEPYYVNSVFDADLGKAVNHAINGGELWRNSTSGTSKNGTLRTEGEPD